MEARAARVTWNGKTGTMADWTGPDPPDGGSHLAYALDEPSFKCPCGWNHRVRADGLVTSFGLVPGPVRHAPAQRERIELVGPDGEWIGSV